MTDIRIRRPAARSSRALGAWLTAAALAGAVHSQAPRFLASTTSDVAGGGAVPVLADADVVAVEPGAPAAARLVAGHWRAAAGFVPSDVDALGRPPGAVPGRHDGLAFSLLANEGGVLDGDVLTFAPGGGLTVLVPEAALVAGLGAPGANVDVDALDWDAAGRLCFSLQADLAGTALGTVEDGDVLRLEADGSVSLVLTEATIATRFAAATGLAASVGDVQGLAWSGGELHVVVQSPSAHDGSVLAAGLAPAVVADEATLGLGGAELDALVSATPGDEPATIRLDVDAGTPGASVTFRVDGGAGGGALLVLVAGGPGWFDATGLPGHGALALDPLDPWLGTWLGGAALPLATLDGSGAAAVATSLPPAGSSGVGLDGSTGWSYQALDVATLEVGRPLRVVAAP